MTKKQSQDWRKFEILISRLEALLRREPVGCRLSSTATLLRGVTLWHCRRLSSPDRASFLRSIVAYFGFAFLSALSASLTYSWLI